MRGDRNSSIGNLCHREVKGGGGGKGRGGGAEWPGGGGTLMMRIGLTKNKSLAHLDSEFTRVSQHV